MTKRNTNSSDDALQRLIINNPLIVSEYSLDCIRSDISTSGKTKAVFMGTGLTTTKMQSIGLPFDYLIYLAVSIQVKRLLEYREVIHLIADTHATGNSFVSDSEVKALALLQKEQLVDGLKDLGLQNEVRILLSSEVEREPYYQTCLRDVLDNLKGEISDTSKLTYLSRELADIVWANRSFGASTKISWMIDPKNSRGGGGFDERWFDRLLQKYTQDVAMSFIYTRSGMNLDRNRPRVSPYTLLPTERRLSLGTTKRFSAELFKELKHDPAMVEHLADIVNEIQKVTLAPIDGSLMERIQFLQDTFRNEGDALFISSTQLDSSFPSETNFICETSVEESMSHLLNGVSEVEPAEVLKEKLEERRPLVVKLGFDPTAPDLHLGHVVVLRQLKKFQDLGHKVIVVIGGYTATIGNPTGRNSSRPPLSPEEISRNADTYLGQLGKILDLAKVQVRDNSEWFNTYSLGDTLRLLSRTTVSQLLQRRDFSNRFQKEIPIHLHEFVYPLLQGSDSVKLEADVEIGGTDQLFNMLMGRQLQTSSGQSGQVIICMPLLVGTCGQIKMSKSKNNHIGITENPNDMFGKLMSLPDEVIPEYISLLCGSQFANRASDLTSNDPMTLKLEIAENIVSQFHGEVLAKDARIWFDRVVRKKSFNEEDYAETSWRLLFGESSRQKLREVVAALRQTSLSQATRLIKDGAVKIGNEKLVDPWILIAKPNERSILIQIGKRQRFRLVE